jgi:hypothetical protein
MGGEDVLALAELVPRLRCSPRRPRPAQKRDGVVDSSINHAAARGPTEWAPPQSAQLIERCTRAESFTSPDEYVKLVRGVHPESFM